MIQRSPVSAEEKMPDVDQFQTYRPLLFSIAYRMLGSATDAEDVVQDVWLRYSEAQPSDVRSPKAYLTTIATRLCLDRLKSARATREQYIGPWLPEPVLTGGHNETDRPAMLAESLTVAFMVLLDTLSPEERAVFLLREVFESSYAEIAETLHTTTANCRQLFHRARSRLSAGRPHYRHANEAKRHLVQRFVDAMLAGNPADLEGVLAEDVGFWGDGGGKVVAARRPVMGRDKVVKLLIGLKRTAPSDALEKLLVQIVEVNGEPAVLLRVGGTIEAVYTCSFDERRITGIRVVRNPAKLTYISRQLVS